MIFSVHTFEVTLTLDTKRFHKIKNTAYDNSKNNYRMFQDKNNPNKYIDTALKDKGIYIEYHDGKYKKTIKAIINPTKMLGGDDIKKLWRPTKENTSKLLSKLKKHLNNYFDGKYKLKNFKLTRVDFTVNIDVGSREAVSDYIKILNNMGKVKGFGLKYSDKDYWIDKNSSFDLEGNSNGVDFTAYDKEAESQLKEAKGILRVEARLMKPKAIRKHTCETDTAKQIKDLAFNSKKIFLEIFLKIIPFGDYYKKKDAVKMVNESNYRKVPKEKMIKLLELIPKKKSLYQAQKEMNDRNIEKIMNNFGELGVSPVTISKRQKGVKHLRSLYDYLLYKE